MRGRQFIKDLQKDPVISAVRGTKKNMRKAGDAIMSIGQNDAVKSVTDFMGGVDDTVQGSIRRLLIGPDEPGKTVTDGGILGGKGLGFLAYPFYARPGAKNVDSNLQFKDNPEGRAAFIGTRVAQGVGVTAAGAGLYSLAVNLGQGEQSPGTIMP